MEDFSIFIHRCRSQCLQQVPRATTVLSIGCAGSWYFDWFDKYYPYKIDKHVGFDLADRPLDLPDNVEWRQGDASNLDSLPSNAFDLVFAGQFIEHIPWQSQVSFLFGVNRVLKNDGYLIIDSPNYDITNRWGWKHPEHIHEISYGQACQISSKAGFDILEGTGLLPKTLLGEPPKQINQYLMKPFDSGQCTLDLQRSISKDPKDCFIWWLTLKKARDLNSDDISTLTSTLKVIWGHNKSVNTKLLFSQLGTPVSVNGVPCVVASPEEGLGFALYGPYQEYPAGKYVAGFDISAWGINDETLARKSADINVCVIDVAVGGCSISRKEIKIRDLVKRSRHMLDYSLHSPCILEFRVSYLGNIPLMIGIETCVLSTEAGVYNMHTSAMAAGRLFFDIYGGQLTTGTVVDVGALDINGTLRAACPSHLNYIDVVLDDPYLLPFADNSIDLIVCSSVFEHTEMFWLSFLEILRVLKPTGLFYLNVPINSFFHRHPVDCWRFNPDSGKALANWGRRNGFNSALLESFVDKADAGGAYNDFVCVILKDEAHVSNCPGRIVQHKVGFTNGLIYGDDTFINPNALTEDMEKLVALSRPDDPAPQPVPEAPDPSPVNPDSPPVNGELCPPAQVDSALPLERNTVLRYEMASTKVLVRRHRSGRR